MEFATFGRRAFWTVIFNTKMNFPIVLFTGNKIGRVPTTKSFSKTVNKFSKILN